MSVKHLKELCGASRIAALATLDGRMTPKLSESAARRCPADSSILDEWSANLTLPSWVRVARKPAPRAHMREADFGFVAVFSDFKSDLCAIPLGPGRESSPDLQLRTLPCCSVTLPALWNSRRESNPDLLIRQSAGPKRHGQYCQSGFRQHDRKLTVQW
jgi:hypothetical protein